MEWFILLAEAVACPGWLLAALANAEGGSPEPSNVRVRSSGNWEPSPRTAPSSDGQSFRWVSAAETVTVADHEIGGTVYLGHRSGGALDPQRALIDPSLRVARQRRNLSGKSLGYWSDYASIGPMTRATYLEWLASCRSDTRYAFLYFYGLEHRYFLGQSDPSERRAIVAEVRRLLDAYGSNSSICEYLGSFLAAAMLDPPAGDEPQPTFARTGRELPMDLRLAIGRMLRDGQRIPADWMLSWLVCHPDTTLRMPLLRALPECRALFRIRFAEQYPQGMVVDAPRRNLQFQYAAASGEFVVDFDKALRQVPDIAELSGPVRQLQAVADSVAKELHRFNRHLSRYLPGPDVRGTIAAHGLLPKPLQPLFPCPELDALESWAKARIRDGGLVPVTELLKRLHGRQPARIQRKELVSASATLAARSIGLAPDPRFGVRGPRMDEPVLLFSLPPGPADPQRLRTEYSNALLMTTAGALVAHADGMVSNEERRLLEERIEAAPRITAAERVWLRANLTWMLAVPPNPAPLRSRLRNASAQLQHELDRLALLALAEADGRNERPEADAAHRLCKVLGLNGKARPRDLRGLVAQREAPGPATVQLPTTPATEFAIPPVSDARRPSSPEGSIRLDPQRIAAATRDTVRVPGVLRQIFSDEMGAADDEERPEPKAEPPSRWAGLDAKHTSLPEEVAVRAEWTEADFENLAQRFGLLPGGALEALNEWAFERFDEPLIEGDGTLEVNAELVEQLELRDRR